MIFSSKAEYGVRLMVELGRHGGEQPTSLKAIAEAERLPLAYLEQVVARLKSAGLVQSSRGAHGGYRLARPAEEITMDEVVLALEGAIAPMECFVDTTTGGAGSQPRRRRQRVPTKLLWMRVQGRHDPARSRPPRSPSWWTSRAASPSASASSERRPCRSR